MIEHVRTVGFKGFDLDEDVPQKVIYTGKNKSGKSTRSGAIAIALYGFIPFSTAGVRPSDVLDSFGDGKMLASAVTINGIEFGSKISRSPKGVVSRSVQIDKKKTSKENFAIMLDRNGAPKIADVAAFMDQSETKKIDTLFDLYPNPELATIDNEIENAKADVSHWKDKKAGAEATIQRLTKSKESYQLPAGNLAETQSEINAVEIQIVELENQIKQAEIEEAETKAKAEGERQEKERAENEKREAEEKAEALQAEKFPPENIKNSGFRWDQKTDPRGDLESIDPNEKRRLDSIPDSPQMQEIDRTISGMENRLEDFKAIDNQEPFHPDPDLTDREFFQSPGQRQPAADSIQRIIDALNGAGCGTCAALIVAKQELKKYGR